MEPPLFQREGSLPCSKYCGAFMIASVATCMYMYVLHACTYKSMHRENFPVSFITAYSLPLNVGIIYAYTIIINIVLFFLSLENDR